MRIALLSDKSWPRFIGGYENRVFNLAKNLSKWHEVRVYTSLDGRASKIGNVDYVRVAPTAFNTDRGAERSFVHSLLFSTSLFTNPMRAWNPDVVIIEAIPYLHLATMRHWIRRTKCAKVLSVNEAWGSYRNTTTPVPEVSTRMIRWLLKSSFDWTDLLIPISNVTAQSLQKNYGARNIEVTPMGLDLKDLRRSVNKADHEGKVFDFVSLGRLTQIKRQSEFIDALGLLKERTQWNGQACIMGDGPMREHLRARARELKLEGHLSFTGPINEDVKFPTLASGRIFVLCSEREGFSLAALEAMACGLPVISARPAHEEVCGVADFLRPGVNGCFYPLGNTEALAAEMDRLLVSKSATGRMSENAERTAEMFDWERICERLSHRLLELVN